MDNAGVDMAKFKFQLTNYLPKEELNEAVKQIEEAEGLDSYGRVYILKRSLQYLNCYAIFTNPDILKKKKKEVKTKVYNDIKFEPGDNSVLGFYHNTIKKYMMR